MDIPENRLPYWALYALGLPISKWKRVSIVSSLSSVITNKQKLLVCYRLVLSVSRFHLGIGYLPNLMMKSGFIWLNLPHTIRKCNIWSQFRVFSSKPSPLVDFMGSTALTTPCSDFRSLPLEFHLLPETLSSRSWCWPITLVCHWRLSCFILTAILDLPLQIWC